MSNVVDTLMEMGFSKQRVEQAVKATGCNDVQNVMEWLLANEEEVTGSEEPVKEEQVNPEAAGENSASPQTQPESGNIEETPAVAKSIKCDDCGKLFDTNEAVEFHATKTGHQSFSESTEEKRPLTDEEKREQLAKIEAKLKARRLEREAKEKEEALLREKNRIKSGKELLEAKKKHEELEMKKIIDQRKKEKEEERLARQRIKEQIEQDKLARKAKFGNQSEPPTPAPTPAAAPVAIRPQTSYSEVKLQIRLPDGSSVTQSFGAKEPLSAVRLFIEMKRNNTQEPFNLMTNFPKKVFQSDDYDKPLESLDLAPTAVLIVKKI
ncbi:UBX domain-containing protein 1 [Diorhabda carinulata]|uniref:UBX domain-containing protein 1 n=1 Tax=Diorhabda carinulata TaxID=1163345 RepID=UPI0025A091C0|nr:UBX domain-containing protein 1 [Diorhabda carinulata]